MRAVALPSLQTNGGTGIGQIVLENRALAIFVSIVPKALICTALLTPLISITYSCKVAVCEFALNLSHRYATFIARKFIETGQCPAAIALAGGCRLVWRGFAVALAGIELELPGFLGVPEADRFVAA
jgi:hypothetical protein